MNKLITLFFCPKNVLNIFVVYNLMEKQSMPFENWFKDPSFFKNSLGPIELKVYIKKNITDQLFIDIKS